MRTARAIILVAAIAALTSAATAQTPLPRLPQPQSQPQLTLPQTNAQLAAPTRREGAFSAGGMEWRCNGLACTSQTVAAPSVSACRALMGQAGQVASYARARVALTAADLAACNQPAAPNLTRLPPPDPSASVVVSVPELNFVGGAAAPTPTDRGGAPVTVSVPELNFVGGAVRAPEARGAPVEVSVPELNFVGSCGGAAAPCAPSRRP